MLFLKFELCLRGKSITILKSYVYNRSYIAKLCENISYN